MFDEKDIKIYYKYIKSYVAKGPEYWGKKAPFYGKFNYKKFTAPSISFGSFIDIDEFFDDILGIVAGYQTKERSKLKDKKPEYDHQTYMQNFHILDRVQTLVRNLVNNERQSCKRGFHQDEFYLYSLYSPLLAKKYSNLSFKHRLKNFTYHSN